MPPLQSIAIKIVKEQELIIGPLAWSEAEKVPGLNITGNHQVAFAENVDPKKVIDSLVAQYERLFGRASHEVCKEAASSFMASLAPGDVPASLLA